MRLHKNDNAKNKINIGYLLTDWREPEVAFFRAELLMKYNRNAFQVFCYVYKGKMESFLPLQDGVSVWRDITMVNPEIAVQTIRNDKIDILVDLSGYKSPGAIAILARKPAEIQTVFVGHFSTTGLKTVDYLLSDKYCDPDEQTEGHIGEKILRLPHTHFCYSAWDGYKEKKMIPLKKNKYVTFGCFWNLVTVSDEFLSAWAKILSLVPEARLVLVSRVFGSGYGCQEMSYRMKRIGFDVSRVEFRKADKERNKAGYQDVDIMLDTFPYQGGLHICDTLYTGVPVIVFAGKKHYSRFGYSILKNIGLEECIGFGIESYVQKAVALAKNPYKLVNLHRNLHERMKKSPLMDVRRYVGNVERTYQDMWRVLQDEKRLANIKLEVSAVLDTILEGVYYIHDQLAAKEESNLIRPLLLDTKLALKQICGVITEKEVSQSIDRMSELVDVIEKKYTRHMHEEICACIHLDMAPLVTGVIKQLKSN